MRINDQLMGICRQYLYFCDILRIMDFEAVAKYVLDRFKVTGVRCAVIGGFALHAAGFPRATQDLGMLERAKIYEMLPGYNVKVAVPEDIIALKLQAVANDPTRAAQDMADVEWLLRNHKECLAIKIRMIS